MSRRPFILKPQRGLKDECLWPFAVDLIVKLAAFFGSFHISGTDAKVPEAFTIIPFNGITAKDGIEFLGNLLYVIQFLL